MLLMAESSAYSYSIALSLDILIYRAKVILLYATLFQYAVCAFCPMFCFKVLCPFIAVIQPLQYFTLNYNVNYL